MRKPLSNILITLFMLMFTGGFSSCYSPDLTTQIYRCDRGKCPEGLFCTDNVFCTQDPPECDGGGIEVSDGIAACISAVAPPDPATLCKGGASVAKCDSLMVEKPLCQNIANCNYCCN